LADWKTPLPAPLSGDARALSPPARDEILSLVRPRPVRFVARLALTWATIVAAIWVAVLADSWLATIAAIVVVGTRQIVLGLLVHEQVHDLGLPKRGGDTLVNLSAAFPLLVLTVEGYAQVHLAHHKYYFTAKDPDFVRKSGPDWAIPMTGRRLARLLLTDLLGLNLLALVKGKRASAPPEFNRAGAPPAIARWSFSLVAGVVIGLLGGWSLVAVYWIVPLLTVTQVLVRWGALCEHKYNLDRPEIAGSSPIILLSWWERLLLPNLNFSLHPYHHYFPGIPYSDLPRVHGIFEREGLVNRRSVFRGYGAFLKFILGADAREPA
jgi:fatty acid desaturase